jgi:hypothetical protein
MRYIGCCDQSKSMKMEVGHDNLLGLKNIRTNVGKCKGVENNPK